MTNAARTMTRMRRTESILDARKQVRWLALCIASLPMFLISVARTEAQTRDRTPSNVRWVWSENGHDSAAMEGALARLDCVAPPKQVRCRLRDCFNDFPLPVRFDEKGLEEETITEEEMVDLLVDPGETFRSTLDSILSPLNLTWRPYPTYLLITNRKNSANVMCVYDVTSMVRNPTHAPEPNKYAVPLVQLMNGIEQSIHPDMWSNAGGTAIMSVLRTDQRVLMIVWCPMDAQLEIQQLLLAIETFIPNGIRTNDVFATRSLHPKKDSRIRASNPNRIR